VKFLVVCKTEEEIKGLYKANGDINILKEKFPEETRLDAFVIQHKETITNTSEEV